MKPIQLFDLKTNTLGFAFCQPPKKSLPKSLTQKKSLQNFKPKKIKSSDRKFQTQKRASHIPVTYIPEYPLWEPQSVAKVLGLPDLSRTLTTCYLENTILKRNVYISLKLEKWKSPFPQNNVAIDQGLLL